MVLLHTDMLQCTQAAKRDAAKASAAQVEYVVEDTHVEESNGCVCIKATQINYFIQQSVGNISTDNAYRAREPRMFIQEQ